MITIYFDNAATSPLSKEVKERMIQAMEVYGNPSSSHHVGKSALDIIEHARKSVANLINATPDRIFFTSGGTESNNWAIYGSAIAVRKSNIITSPIEHHAIIRGIENFGKSISISPFFIPVDSLGVVDQDILKSKINKGTALVSIMMANNEVGTVQDIKTLAQIAHDKGVLFHTDAVQAVGKINVNVEDLDIDMLSISAHKFHGPKGVGALYIKKGIEIHSLIAGGRQEQDRRAGTQNVISIVGMGRAAECVEIEKNKIYINDLISKLKQGIKEKIPNVKFNGHPIDTVPGILNVYFEGIESKRLVFELNKIGICVSSGSACSEGGTESSHVLSAMGIPAHEAHSCIRFSLSKFNKKEEIDRLLEILPSIIKQLRHGL